MVSVAIEREKQTTARWKIVIGGAVAVLAGAGGGTYITTRVQGSNITPNEVSSIVRMAVIEGMRPLENRVTSLEGRNAMNESMIAAMNAELRPRLAAIQNDVSESLQAISYIKGKLEERK